MVHVNDVCIGEHHLSHPSAASDFPNYPKAETADICFHNCFPVVRLCKCEEFCWNPKLVATVWDFLSMNTWVKRWNHKLHWAERSHVNCKNMKKWFRFDLGLAAARGWYTFIYVYKSAPMPAGEPNGDVYVICLSLPKNILMQSCRKMARNSNADRCMADAYGFPGWIFDAEVLKAVGGWAVVVSLRPRGAAWQSLPKQNRFVCVESPGSGIGVVLEMKAVPSVWGRIAARWSWHKARKLRTQILGYCNTK